MQEIFFPDGNFRSVRTEIRFKRRFLFTFQLLTKSNNELDREIEEFERYLRL